MAKSKDKSANSFISAFNSMKSKILKAPSNKAMDKVDDVLNRISDTIVNKDTINQAEMLRKVFSDTIDTSMFNGISSNVAFSTELAGRLNRYANAEEICDSIPYCARALKVLSNEIVSPDSITKEILQFTQEEDTSDKEKSSFSDVRSISRVLNIEDHLHDLVYETLKLGDQFVEICDYTSEDVPLTQSILNEKADAIIPLQTDYDLVSKVYDESGKEQNKITKIKPIIEEAKTSETVDISRIRLIIHDPYYIIKLQSRRFKLCLGYLVLPRPSNPSDPLQPSTGMNAGFQSRLRNILAYSSTNQDFLGIDKLYIDIMKQVKMHIGDENLSINHGEVKTMIQRVIKELDEDSQGILRIRYVPPERMQHITIYNRRFFPYGEGIFYKTTFAAKLMTAFQVALVMKRIADSSDKRAIYMETGIPRNVRNLIEEIKEAMQKKKFSLDTLGNIGSIPSMITSYETYFLPQNKGKKYVEFDTVTNPVSIRDISDELKFFRDELVSSLEVPPSYLNLEENLSNKNALSFENQLFARTVTSYQSRLSKYIRGLFSKIYKIVHAENMPLNIKISLMPPKMLELEREAEHTETITRLITSLSELGISREYLKRKYLSIDWDKLEKFETEEELDKKSEPKKPTEGGEGGFGAY